MGDDEPIRRSWHGMGQARPRLPAYLRPGERRLKSLDEFEEPEWKGRVRFGEGDDEVTVKGVVRETLQWLLIFAIVGLGIGFGWVWFAGADGCAQVTAGFKIGWC